MCKHERVEEVIKMNNNKHAPNSEDNENRRISIKALRYSALTFVATVFMLLLAFIPFWFSDERTLIFEWISAIIGQLQTVIAYIWSVLTSESMIFSGDFWLFSISSPYYFAIIHIAFIFGIPIFFCFWLKEFLEKRKMAMKKLLYFVFYIELASVLLLSIYFSGYIALIFYVPLSFWLVPNENKG